MEYSYKYPRPSVSVDIMIFSKLNQKIEVLLIRRKNPPFKQLFALPGGFMDMDESLEEAAIRELKEETNIDIKSLLQFGIYDKPDRDPRGRTLSVIFYAIFDKKPDNIEAGDDAQMVKWCDMNKLPELAFDHTQILKDSGVLFDII
ncbi:MAG: NUDIX hydrolase [Bacteroidales bacterium]|nr:NUDIX hydrolase [Bacteroidales bacterium]